MLVTGVAGFIGSRIAVRLIGEGYEVFGVDDLSMGRRSAVPKEVDFVELDCADAKMASNLPKEFDQIFHLAGQSSGEISFDDPVADLEKNTVSTLNLIRLAIDCGAPRFLYASSMSVYGATADAPIAETHPAAPLSCYGVGKLASENYLRVFAKQLPSVSLRMFNVYGPGQDMSNLRQGMISIYVAQAMKDNKIVVKGSLDRFRDFVYIDDVVEAWIRASRSIGAVGKSINIGTGARTSVAEVTRMISAILPGTAIEISDPTPGDQVGIYADCTLARNLLGEVMQVQLADGLQRFVNFLQK